MPTRSLSSFVATRPVSAAMLVRAKFEAAALSTLACWGLLLFGILLWIALSGSAAELTASLNAFRQRHPAVPFWGCATLFLSGAVVLTWLQLVQGLWLGLTGRTWMWSGGLLGNGGILVLMELGEWLWENPHYGQTVSVFLPWLTGGIVALKCLAAAWSLHALHRRGLVPPRVLYGGVAVWLVLAAGSYGALYALLPQDHFSVSGVVLAIVLLLPLTRLALAPLALNGNRHR